MTAPKYYTVWAPQPKTVELFTGGMVHPMEALERGWWLSEVERRPGARYGFCLDGAEPRPDPRSQSQPDGIHALSEVIDHDSYSWRDQQWRGHALPGSILYELHIGTFTTVGTFDAAIERLDHLVALGVDAVELMPVAEFPGRRGWGYDGVALSAPHHAYGGPEALKRFVDACHRVGLGVVLDVVYNHLGPAGNYLPEFGPYFSNHHTTMWGPGINLDSAGCDEVRRWIVDNAMMWLHDYHIDGLRLDAVHALSDDSARHVLEDMSVAVAAEAGRVDRPLFLIAESDRNDPRFMLPVARGGLGLDAAWADDWHHAVHAMLTGERAGYYGDFDGGVTLCKALEAGWVHDGIWSDFRQRTYGRSPTGLTGDQFVVSIQNHDQVGNRACGERLADLLSPGRARLAAALMLTSRFTPMLFQGEEWAAGTPFLYMTDHADPELGAAVSTGRRDEFARFGWAPTDVPDPQDEATFTASILNWTELELSPHAGMLAWYRDLIDLRRRLCLGTSGAPVHARFNETSGLLRVEHASVAVVANLGAHDLPLEVDTDTVMLAWPPLRPAGAHGGAQRVLIPDGVVVLERTVPPIGG